MNYQLFFENILNNAITFGLDLLIILAVFLIARICVNIVSHFTRKTMNKADEIKDEEVAKQLRTSMTITHSANRYVVYIVAIIICARIIGFGEEMSSAIITAGVGGLVISFGAQSIVKDMIAGLFLMFEKQYFVGDHVKINDYEGKVTSIALRATYLNCSGKVVIIPNGQISEVVNFSKSDGLAFVNVTIDYKSNYQKALDIFEKVANQYYDDNPELFTEERPRVYEGISEFKIQGATLTCKFYTKSCKHWKVEREVRLLIAKAYQKAKIEIKC